VSALVVPPPTVTPHADTCDCRLCRPRPLVDDVPDLATPRPRSVAELGAQVGYELAKAQGATPLARGLAALIGGLAGAYLDAKLKEGAS
jgi:hypothetical protein